MTNLLSVTAKILRSELISPRLSYKVWQVLSRLNHGKSFFFPLKSSSGNIANLIYGGVCGYSDNALFFDLENYEKEIQTIYNYTLNKYKIPVVIDVGANNGQSLMITKFINPASEVHCFEPFTELTNFLTKLVKINDFDRVYINNYILSDTTGSGKLFFAKNYSETASIVNDFQNFYDQSLSVSQITLDDYVKDNNIPEVSLLKIDVEGGELEVIKGAKEVIRTMKPDILMELLFTEKHYERQKETVNILKSFGYNFYQIRDNGLILQEDVIPDQNYKFLNYFVTTELNPTNIE